MDTCVVRIEKLENGYQVELLDPELQKRNDQPKSRYVNPWRAYACESSAKVIELLTANLEKIKPENPKTQFAEAFAAAASEGENDDND